MKYPNRSYKAPDISGKWKWKAEYLKVNPADPDPKPIIPSFQNPGKLEGEVTIDQNNLFFKISRTTIINEDNNFTFFPNHLGVFKPNAIYINGKCHLQWVAHSANSYDHAVLNYTFFFNKKNKIYKIYASEPQPAVTGHPDSTVMAVTYERKCKK